jgi:hypothetical protein
MATTATVASTTAAVTTTAKSAASLWVPFACRLMSCVPYVALSVASLVPVKMIERLLATPWHRPLITMMGVIAVINMSIEAARTVEPPSSANEDTSIKPIRTVKAIRSAIIRGIVEISVGTDRFHANGNPNL